MEAAACGRYRRNQLSTSPRDDYAAVCKNIGSGMKTDETHIRTAVRVGLLCTPPAWTSRQRSMGPGPSRLRKSWEINTPMDGLQQLLLREMKGPEGHAAFESVDSKINVARCIRQGGVEAPRLWLKLSTVQVASLQRRRRDGQEVIYSLTQNRRCCCARS